MFALEYWRVPPPKLIEEVEFEGPRASAEPRLSVPALIAVVPV